jgi:hypothetical protein
LSTPFPVSHFAKGGLREIFRKRFNAVPLSISLLEKEGLREIFFSKNQ